MNLLCAANFDFKV